MNFDVFIELQKRKLKYEKTPKRNELLPLNYAYCLLSPYSACRFGDLEREAQEPEERGLQRAIEVICLFSKLHPFATDDVKTIPFAQVCFNGVRFQAVYC